MLMMVVVATMMMIIITHDTDARVLVVDQLLLGLEQHLVGHLRWARIEVEHILWCSRHVGCFDAACVCMRLSNKNRTNVFDVLSHNLSTDRWVL